MILIKKIFYSLFSVFLMQGTIYSQNLLDYPNSLKYADYLYKTNQYKLAAVEFERVVFLEPNDTLSKLKLVRSYRYLKDYSTARKKIENFFSNSLADVPEEFSVEYIKNLLYENQFQKTSGFLQTNKKINSAVKIEYQLGIYIMQCQWAESRRFADKHMDILDKTENCNKLNNLITVGLHANYKSPLLAGSLSAIVPGSGKVYCGKWKDAIYSFLFVTASSWLTYKSFDNKGFNFGGVVLGSFALTFYSANIYGSVKSAKVYNQKINQSLKIEAEDILLNDKEK
jgi:hypothetical protein